MPRLLSVAATALMLPALAAQSPTESDWLRFSAIHRSRFESLSGQFRADASPPAPPRRNTEDQWFFRTSVRADIDLAPLGGTLELMDGRAYGGNGAFDTGTGFVNTTDIVQAFASWTSGEHRVRAGRWAQSIGSRRFVIRNGYRNTINTFSGAEYYWHDDRGQDLRVFWTMPVRRRPFDAPSLRDNQFEWDDQDPDLQFFGVFGTRRLDDRSTLEGYVFGLEEDTPGSLMRHIYTPGLRYFRPAAPGDWFCEVETTFQFGRQRLAAAGPSLDHNAWFVHGSVGYQWDCTCLPTVRFAYDHATGDRDPNDGDNNRFDRLFGAPRFEQGPTGLWSAIQRSNFRSPELRVSFKPTADSWIMVAWRDLSLAASRDVWVGSGVRDATGASGDRIGHHVELRARFDFLPGTAYIEVGGAYLFAGSFLDRAPNSQGGRDSRYAYVETIWTL